MTIKAEHDSRIQTTLDYIKANLERPLSVAELSQVAGMSKYHFHRKFLALVGVNTSKAIRLLRFKRACYQLAFNKSLRVIDIAFDAGFETPEAFSRAFRRYIGLSPTAFRKHPEWTNARIDMSFLFVQKETDMEVEIREFKATKIAVLEHRGPPSEVYASALKFVDWRKKYGPKPNRSRTFNILYDDPDTVSAKNYRMDICAEVLSDVKANEFNIKAKTITTCICAVLRHRGSWDTLGQSVGMLYANWLPESEYKLGTFPIFVERVNLFPAVPEHELITDIYMPVTPR